MSRLLPKKEIVRGFLSIIIGLALWEVSTRLLLDNELLIPPPSSVLISFWNLLSSGELNRHLVATLIEFICGFVTACLIGIILGYLMGMYKWFDEIMDPWIATLYSIPIITVVPLIIIWFGIGIFSKVVVVFKITAVAIILNTAAGIKSLDPVWRLADDLQDSLTRSTPLHHHRYETGGWPSAARRHRRGAHGRQRRLGFSAPRVVGNLGQPEALRHRNIAGRHGTCEF
jgi:hypothetical protein